MTSLVHLRVLSRITSKITDYGNSDFDDGKSPINYSQGPEGSDKPENSEHSKYLALLANYCCDCCIWGMLEVRLKMWRW